MPIYQTDNVPIAITKFGGGLNTASGPLNLEDNESNDLRNVDFDKFGSFKERNGYNVLTVTAISGTATGLGLYWYQTATAQKAINISGNAVYRMDDLDGTWDSITGIALSTN